MCAEFYGDSDGSFFSFEAVNKNRRIQFPMLPDKYAGLLPSCNKLKILPKVPGERRILSADIALMASTSHQNDATAIFINQCMPTKAHRFMNNVVYTESNEGLTTEAEALVIRKLFDEFDCDYIVLDVKSAGLGIYDALIRDITDPETGEVYPGLSCCNNPDYAARCKVRNARKVIWAVNGSAKFNSDCALMLREGFRSGRIRLLNTEYEAEEALGEIKGWGNLNESEHMALMMPYINTTLLINELIKLNHEESSGLVRLSERRGMRKDRYSSLSYNYYVSLQLEKNIRRDADHDIGRQKEQFIFRAPITKKERR